MLSMKGWLIVNAYLCGKKYDGIHNMLMDAAERQGVGLKLIGNDEVLVETSDNAELPVDFVLFWDKDVKLCEYLEKRGVRVFNGSRALAVCDDKALTALALMDKNVPMPETVLAPMTFPNIGYTDYGFVRAAGERLGYPLVLKECCGSFGHEVYLMNSYDELLEKVKSLGVKPMLFQRLIKESFGRDVRVQVVGHKVVAAVTRVAPTGSLSPT
jgi:Glutathione synthase/Ribosomal protein S6 modification enzyme (glutaminyl transferase)